THAAQQIADVGRERLVDVDWLVKRGTHIADDYILVLRMSELMLRSVGQCPLWVISGHFALQSACLLYPRKRTFGAAIVMSAKGQKWTSSRLIRSRRRQWRARLMGWSGQVLWQS